MKELTKEMRLILKENGLRGSSDIIDQIYKDLYRILEKSASGEKCMTSLVFGNKVKLKLIICTNEIDKLDVSIYNNDGISVFSELGLQIKDAEVDAYTQWLYAACENTLLSQV